MWQRIQTVWWLLALVLMAVMPWQDLFIFTKEAESLVLNASNFSEGFLLEGLSLILWNTVLPLSMLSALISLVSIFIYKKRILQMRLSTLNSLLLLALIGVLSYIAYEHCATLVYDFGFTFYLSFPLVSFIAQLLARRGVVKDETLIRVSQRLR